MSKLLIIEDEETIAEQEKDYLELSGFDVEIETSGNKGLERALKEDFDPYILDLMLPEIDGFEICKKIRKTKRNSVNRKKTTPTKPHKTLPNIAAFENRKNSQCAGQIVE